MNTYDPEDEFRGLLEDFEELRDPEFALTWEFMIRALVLIENCLPESAKNGLKTVLDFRAGTATVDDLTAARVLAWKRIGVLEGNSISHEHPETRALRAVICALYPDHSDRFETIYWFAFFSNLFEDRWTEQVSLLKELIVRGRG